MRVVVRHARIDRMPVIFEPLQLRLWNANERIEDLREQIRECSNFRVVASSGCQALTKTGQRNAAERSKATYVLE